MRILPNFFHVFRHTTYEYLKNRSTPFIYVALGDSTAEGMGATTIDRGYTSIVYLSLKERYRQAKYYNFARGGAVILNVLESQLPKALEQQPTLLTISVGANDIISRTKVEVYEERLRKIISELQNKTKAIIVVSTLPDLSLTPAVPKLLKTYSRYKAGKLNEIIRKVGKDTNIVVADMFENSKAVLQAFPEAVASDGWHPSDFGYALWANTILVTLRNVIASPEEEKPQKEEEEK